MDLHLKGKAALVTGGSHGLGRAVCLGLAAEGARVAVNYHRNPEEAERLAREIQAAFGVDAVAVAGSVGLGADVAAMFDVAANAIGPLDILVNNAAVCPSSFVQDISEEEWALTMQVNLTGTFLTCREMVKRLVASGRRGRIVNVSSTAAYTGSSSGRSHYDASKGAVISFTISLARECARHGIAVNAVAPGFMLTKMTAERLEANKEKYLAVIPLRRFGETEEIASVVVFLASERASYMTGAAVNASGGLLMG
jgi:3-oxoacyl-[acyl-carrier protein] reductase